MTQISTTSTSIHKPDSVAFGELAIAAGLSGRPVALCFSESAAAIDCELLTCFAQLTGPSQVLHVHSQADVTKLRKSVGSWRLVVVHSLRLFNTVAWTVQTHGSETSARPTIFSRIVPTSADDVPTPLLVLRNTPYELASIIRWLMAGSPQQAVLPSGSPANGINFDPTLDPVTMPNHLPNGRGPARLRDCQLLAALMHGACLTGNAANSPGPTDVVTCGPHEYERVRRLLQSPLVNTSDEPVDQLAVEMVNRTNAFLELKCDPEFYYAHPTLCGRGDTVYRQSGSHTHQELVSRREITDLGNVHSQLVKQAVDWLRRRPDGYNRFRRMGLVRQPPIESAFMKSEPQRLTMMLRSWSPKQVRTQFDALRKSGLITGERKAGNGSWEYRIPEELNAVSSPFDNLPKAEELMIGTGASA